MQKRISGIITRRISAMAGFVVLTSFTVSVASAQRGGGGGNAVAPVSGMKNGKLGIVVKDGMLQPVTEFADTSTWIHQRVWVETNFDSDFDGKKDRLHVDITRPGNAEKAGLKLPVIMESSPYAGGTNSGNNFLWNVGFDVGVDPGTRTSRPANDEGVGGRGIGRPLGGGFNSWVAKGLIAVSSEQPGTGLSTGCPTVGDYFETEAPRFVIDWLNGRAKAFTSVDGNEEVKATGWTNGVVGMTGTSYLGTLPLSAAITGVAGLKAIIPISPNTSYYAYYRSNGLVRSPGGYLGEDVDFLYDYVHSGKVVKACDQIWRDGLFHQYRDRASGDFNSFWQLRDQLPYAKNIKAAVLFAHGTHDYNVVPEHTLRMWDAVKNILPSAKLYIHKGGHGGGPSGDLPALWWAHYLWNVDNGVEKLPRVFIMPDPPVNATPLVQPPPSAGGRRGAGGGGGRGGALDSATTAALANAKTAADSAAVITASRGAIPAGGARGGRGGRGAAPPVAGDTTAAPPARGGGRGGRGGGAAAATGKPWGAAIPFSTWPVPGSAAVTVHPNKGGNSVGALTFMEAPKQGVETLTDDWQIEPGTMAQAANSQNRLLFALPKLKDSVHVSGYVSVTLKLALSKSAGNLSVYLVTLPFDATTVGTSDQMGIVTRGWADPRNYKSLTHVGDYHSLIPGEDLVPGKFYTLTYGLQPTDQTILPGEQLAIMIMSSDHNFTLHPTPGTQMSIDLDASSFTLPIVGGLAKLKAATGSK